MTISETTISIKLVFQLSRNVRNFRLEYYPNIDNRVTNGKQNHFDREVYELEKIDIILLVKSNR